MRVADKTRVHSVCSFVSLYLLLCIGTACGQISVPEHSRIGEPLIASTPFEAKVYDWEPSAGAKVIAAADGKSVFIWAREGKHSLKLTAVTEDFKLHKWTAEFTVDDSPAPPTPATLRDLVSADEAKAIAEYFTDFSKLVSSLKSAEQFWSAFDQTFPVKGNAALDSALRARLEGPVAKKLGLSAELLAIAAEFEKPAPVPPTPVPVVEGKRVVLIVHESADKTPEFGEMIVELRKPGTDAAEDIKAKGHELLVLDDELLGESKWNAVIGSQVTQTPMLFVIDPRTNAILFKTAIPTGYTADNVTERIRETGG